MQICALDLSGSLVFADNAHKHQDYLCTECNQLIRLRRGIHRKAHYYHIQPNRICRQHSKGMPHLMLQQFLKKLLPEGEVELECQFRSINRIADVAWHPKRLIYEIQCSPISAEEVNTRNKNYASIGYQVIWIFHDNRYNQPLISAAENSLCDHPHYFSNMDAEGNGIIYDQLSINLNNKRTQRLPPLPIDVSLPKWISKSQLKTHHKLPKIIKRRLQVWPLLFSGDTLDRSVNQEGNEWNDTENQREFFLEMEKLCAAEKNTLLWSTKIFIIMIKKIILPYQAFIKLILERACR